MTHPLVYAAMLEAVRFHHPFSWYQAITYTIPRRKPSEAERMLKLLLQQSKWMGHARCIAHAVGVYPC